MARYKFYHSGKKTICVSSYAKRPVRGISICDEGDEYNTEAGEALAKARVDVKVAKQRMAHANKRYADALCERNVAEQKCRQMLQYQMDAAHALSEARRELYELEDELG